jgi:hypothetical protein
MASQSEPLNEALRRTKKRRCELFRLRLKVLNSVFTVGSNLFELAEKTLRGFAAAAATATTDAT